METKTSTWECEINGKTYAVEIPNDHPGGFLYFDHKADTVIFDGRPPHEMHPEQYTPLCGFKPKAARAAGARTPTIPLNRAQRRQQLSLVRKGKIDEH